MRSGKEGNCMPVAPERAAVSLSPARHVVALPFLEGESWGSQAPPERREIPPLPHSFSAEATSDGDLPCRPTPSSAPVGVRALTADPSPTTIPPCSVAWVIFGFGHSLLPLLAQVTSCLSQRGDGQQGRDKVKEDQKVSQLLSFRLCTSRQFYTFVSYPFDS